MVKNIHSLKNWQAANDTGTGSGTSTGTMALLNAPSLSGVARQFATNYTNTWDYTANEGSPQNPVDVWLHSTASCNPRNWSTNAWHHVQITYSRDTIGNVTYKPVWLDGVEQDLNVTVSSAFALGWGSTLLTNFQVDGLGGYGSSTVYLDKLTIYRW